MANLSEFKMEQVQLSDKYMVEMPTSKEENFQF